MVYRNLLNFDYECLVVLYHIGSHQKWQYVHHYSYDYLTVNQVDILLKGNNLSFFLKREN